MSAIENINRMLQKPRQCWLPHEIGTPAYFSLPNFRLSAISSFPTVSSIFTDAVRYDRTAVERRNAYLPDTLRLERADELGLRLRRTLLLVLQLLPELLCQRDVRCHTIASSAPSNTEAGREQLTSTLAESARRHGERA